MPKTEKKQKATSEKPVSLHPLNLDEALRGLLAIKPHKKAKTEEKSAK